MVNVRKLPNTAGKGEATKETKNVVSAKEPAKGAMDVRALREAGEFQVVFYDGKGMKCGLVDADNYNILVLWEGKKVLIPKHSIKYVLLGG